MSVTLINNTGSDVTLYATSGEAGAFHVKDGDPVEIPGEIENADTAEDDGFFLIGDGTTARVWPASVWEVQGSPARSTRRRPSSTTNTEED